MLFIKNKTVLFIKNKRVVFVFSSAQPLSSAAQPISSAAPGAAKPALISLPAYERSRSGSALSAPYECWQSSEAQPISAKVWRSAEPLLNRCSVVVTFSAPAAPAARLRSFSFSLLGFSYGLAVSAPAAPAAQLERFCGCASGWRSVGSVRSERSAQRLRSLAERLHPDATYRLRSAELSR